MNGGFIYKIIRPFAKITIGAYFRKLHISNAERIPVRGPLIVACNHPNSFTEACVLATYQSRTLHFLVRGDVFRQPVIAWFLKQTNQIPIYRFRDGFSGLKKNENTFSACYEKLANGAAIVIFAEASSVFEKRLRPIQKGTARLAFGAWEKKQIKEELHILPVGINYTHGDRFRSELMLNFGEPLRLSDYRDSYLENAQHAINNLTADLEMAMKELVIHIDKPNDQLFDDLSDLLDADNPAPSFPVVTRNQDRFLSEKKLSEKLNSMNPDELKVLNQQMSELKKLLHPKFNQLTDLRYLKKPTQKSIISLITGSLISILGVVFHIIPFYLSRLVSIPFLNLIEFYTGVRLGSLLIFAAFQQVLLDIFTLITQNWLLFLLILGSPFAGAYSVLYIEYIFGNAKHKKLNKHQSNDKIKTLTQEITLQFKEDIATV